MGSIYVICSRQCPNGDGIYTLLYALYKYSTSITNQPMLARIRDDTRTRAEGIWGKTRILHEDRTQLMGYLIHADKYGHQVQTEIFKRIS